MKQTIFILSAAHSGSTLLDLMIGSHPECFSLGEFCHVEQIIRGSRTCSICGEMCDFWSRFRERVDPPEYHQCASECAGDKILIDSSKQLDWQKRSIANIDRFLVIDLRRICYGALLYKLSKGDGIRRKDVEKWVRTRKEIDNHVRWLGANALSVNYEDLCEDPETVLNRICKFISIDFDPCMLKFWEGDHHICGGNGKPVRLIKQHRGLPVSDPANKGPITQKFHETTGFEIKPDYRYKEFMHQSQIEMINQVAGRIMRRYKYRVEV